MFVVVEEVFVESLSSLSCTESFSTSPLHRFPHPLVESGLLLTRAEPWKYLSGILRSLSLSPCLSLPACRLFGRGWLTHSLLLSPLLILTLFCLYREAVWGVSDLEPGGGAVPPAAEAWPVADAERQHQSQTGLLWPGEPSPGPE